MTARLQLPLGILDQSPVVAGATPAEAIAATVALARRADELGFRRYWCAEHHGRYGFADASPELIVARLAAETHRIRLGTGGVLLSHYSALKVAENFRMLEALAAGRIDLGLGRASGSDLATELALRGDAAPHDYARQVQELLAFLDGRFPAGHPFERVAATPRVESAPEVWLLGSSDYSAQLAASLGLPYAYAHFIAGEAPAVTRRYRAQYRPSARFPRPQTIVAATAFCDDSPDERADFLRCLGLWRARVRLEDDPRMPSRDEARTYVPNERERHFIAEAAERSTVASSGGIREHLAALAGRHGADELLLICVAPDYASRQQSYENIARACGLPAIARFG